MKSESEYDDLKSPISLVHEIALKRNLSVSFAVTLCPSESPSKSTCWPLTHILIFCHSVGVCFFLLFSVMNSLSSFTMDALWVTECRRFVKSYFWYFSEGKGGLDLGECLASPLLAWGTVGTHLTMKAFKGKQGELTPFYRRPYICDKKAFS